MKSQKACFDQYGTVCEHLSGGCQRNRFYYCSFVMARLSFLYVFNASCQQQCARVTRLRYLQRRTQENKISKNKNKQTNKQKHTHQKRQSFCAAVREILVSHLIKKSPRICTCCSLSPSPVIFDHFHKGIILLPRDSAFVT